jgi:hypothetical protein
MLPIKADIDDLMDDAAAAGFFPDDDPDISEQPDWDYYPPPGEVSEPPPPKIRLIRCSDLLTPQPVTWLIRSILEAGTLAGAFGASASGKSFAAVDMALCIASGKDWHGYQTERGTVVYFAGEGQAGLRRRISAWMQSNPDNSQAAIERFFLAERACTLPDETADVIQTLASVPDVKLVILDTLQRTMDGDENSTRDMSAYVRSLDAIKAAFPELSIMVVHHTGHGVSDRARGSSALKASLDAEILISRDAAGVITAQCTKAKDAEPFAPLSFRLESVILEGWEDDAGQPVTSAVLRHLEGHQQVQEWRAKVRGKNHKAAVTVLETLYQAQRRNLGLSGFEPDTAQVKVSDWRDDCLKQKITRKASQFDEEVMDKLIEKGIIRTAANGLYVEIVG